MRADGRGLIAKVRLFGTFRVERGGEAASFPTRPTASLVAFLASRGGRALPRQTVAAAVWPDADPERAANNLRTALVYGRRALAPWQPFHSDRSSIALNGVDADIDLVQAERLYRAGRITQNSQEERDTLVSLLEIIGRDFLEGETWPWAEAIRIEWRERRVEAALRVAQMGRALEDYTLAESECLRALETDEFNEEAWAAFLAVAAGSEQQSAAIERFHDARQRLLSELDSDFSSELVSLSRRVSLGQVKGRGEGAYSSAGARDVMAKAMDRQLAEDPESVLPLFASDSFRREAMKDPPEAWKILRDAIERTGGISEARIKAMMLAISLADMVDEYGTAMDYAEWMAENLPEERREHRYAINLLGFMSFELREWEDAWRHLRRFRELAEAHGSPVEVSIAKSQIASLHWHQGDFELALAEYQAQLEVIEEDNSTMGLHNAATLRANIGIVQTVVGQWEEAFDNLSHAYKAAQANNFDYIRSLVLAPLGLAMILQGRRDEGRKMVSHGLSLSYRSRYRRMHQICADYAAGALAVLDMKPLARSMLDSYTTFRRLSFHSRSVSEEKFAGWVLERCEGAPAGSMLPADARVSTVVAIACDALESAARP